MAPRGSAPDNRAPENRAPENRAPDSADDRPWSSPGDDQRTAAAAPGDEPTSHRAGADGTAGAKPASPLSAVKVSGQAAAAVTTAGFGSLLGGASGTVIGAGIAAVITTVGDALYQRSIERTRDHVRSRLRTRKGPGEAGDAGEEVDGVGERATVLTAPAGGRGGGPDEAPTVVMGTPDATRVGAAQSTMAQSTMAMSGSNPGDPRTRAIGDDATQAVGPGTRVMGGPDDEPTVLHGAPPGTDRPDHDPEHDADPPRRTPWKRYGVLAATALLIFLIAMLAVTGIERVKGSPLSGGESGTSFGEVFGTAEPTTSTSAPETTTSGESPAEGSATSTGEESTSTTGSTSTSRTTTSERPPLVPSGLLPGN